MLPRPLAQLPPPPLEDLYPLKPKGWFDAQFKILYEGASLEI